MSTREQEVALYLAADTDLAALAPGGIYSASSLGVEGITDPVAAPDVWQGGFQTSIEVRQGAAVPAFGLVDLKNQVASESQAIRLWIYSREMSEIEEVRVALYGLMQGKKFAAAFKAERSGGIDTRAAVEFPAGTYVGREDYQVVSIRQPA